MDQHRTLLRELSRILLISACFWGAFGTAWWWHHRQQQARAADERFLIKRLAARSVTTDRLPLAVLSELLELDAVSPMSIFGLSSQQARKKLLRCPAIADVHVWKLLPRTLGVEYMLRTPVAVLAGVKNVGIDDEGKLFFLFPLYAPKKLPQIVLPIPPVKNLSEAQRAICSLKESAIALQLLDRVQDICTTRPIVVDTIDVSKMPQHNVFRREIVIVFSSPSSRDQRLFVRIHLDRLLLSLDLLPKLFDQLLHGAFRSGSIDLRFPHMAIISGEVAQK